MFPSTRLRPETLARAQSNARGTLKVNRTEYFRETLYRVEPLSTPGPILYPILVAVRHKHHFYCALTRELSLKS